MTLYVNDINEKFSSNNILINGTLQFILTSGFAKTSETFPCVLILQNERYSEMELTFPADFKDQHKNGVYYYTIQNETDIFEKGYLKLITEPGGSNGAVAYNSGTVTENRESAVYFRPNY